MIVVNLRFSIIIFRFRRLTVTFIFFSCEWWRFLWGHIARNRPLKDSFLSKIFFPWIAFTLSSDFNLLYIRILLWKIHLSQNFHSLHLEGCFFIGMKRTANVYGGSVWGIWNLLIIYKQESWWWSGLSYYFQAVNEVWKIREGCIFHSIQLIYRCLCSCESVKAFLYKKTM